MTAKELYEEYVRAVQAYWDTPAHSVAEIAARYAIRKTRADYLALTGTSVDGVQHDKRRTVG